MTPNTRPRVVFNSSGICNACINNQEKNTVVDWKKRLDEFTNIIDKIKSKNKKQYDCIVPWSGGKDSTYIALRLKNDFDLNPLLVTFAPLIPNHIGNHNREVMLKYGFDSIYFRPNQKVAKLLAKRFFIERGNPKLLGTRVLIPFQLRLLYIIKLMMSFTLNMVKVNMAVLF